MKKKRSIEDIDDPTLDELYSKISRMKEPYRSYIAFLYLTGNRVSEVLGIPNKAKDRTPKDPEWEVRPVQRWDITISPESNMLRVKTRTFKREDRPTHIYVCRIDTDEERRYYEIVKEHLDTLQPEDTVWNFSRFKAWRYCNLATGLPPHKLRGLRATRDAIEFELDAIDLKQKFNWSNPEMAFKYASKSSHDIEKKLLRK